MTRQAVDFLVWQGKEYRLISYLDVSEGNGFIINPDWPESVDKKVAAGDFSDIDTITTSTACQRGYLATWEIVDGELFLKDLVGKYMLPHGEAIRADWVSRTVDASSCESSEEWDSFIEFTINNGAIDRIVISRSPYEAPTLTTLGRAREKVMNFIGA